MYGSRAGIESQLKGRLVALTTDTGTEVDWDVVDAARVRASAMIDASTPKYLVPWAEGSVPALVDSWANDLAVYFLVRDANPTEAKAFRSLYTDVTEQLAQLAAGTVTLGTPEPPANPARLIKTNSNAQVFTDRKLEGL